MKKAKFPIEATALGMILFSKNMQEAMITGILVIFSAVFADTIKQILKNKIPEWSETICLLLLTGSICASAFTLSYAVLGWEQDTALWILHLILGLLCARYVLWKGSEKNISLIQTATIWCFWILFAALREFLSFGTIFDIVTIKTSYQSTQFQKVVFGFLVAGLATAFTNTIFKTRQPKKASIDKETFYVLIPAVCFSNPLHFSFLNNWIGTVLGIAVTLLFFVSIQKKIAFSRPGKAYQGLPTELLSMGFLYMILALY